MCKKIAGLILVLGISLGFSQTSLAANEYNLKSCNTLAFSCDQGSIEIYAADINLLADKIFTMPDQPWDPGLYATNKH